VKGRRGDRATGRRGDGVRTDRRHFLRIEELIIFTKINYRFNNRIMTVNRRKFISDTTRSAAGFMLGTGLTQPSVKRNGAKPAFSDLKKECMKYRKIDSHNHVWFRSDPAEVIDFADRLGIEKIVISQPVTSTKNKEDATPDMFRSYNDYVLKAMKLYPDRFLGKVTFNVFYQKESLEEINRCIGEGMVGMKIYHQVKINDPLFYPVIEKAIELKMIILVHASTGLGFGGQRTKYGNNQPNASIPENFVEVAKRYPGVMLQYAHTGGGGDWEYACKMLSPCANIFVDISGSNNEGNMVDFALRYIGEDRLFFGTDGGFYQGVGTILSSSLSEVQKKKLFFDNYNLMLSKSGNRILK
jgi:predicted TIM-barrel fold metal-dependent hydrolase